MDRRVPFQQGIHFAEALMEWHANHPSAAAAAAAAAVGGGRDAHDSHAADVARAASFPMARVLAYPDDNHPLATVEAEMDAWVNTVCHFSNAPVVSHQVLQEELDGVDGRVAANSPPTGSEAAPADQLQTIGKIASSTNLPAAVCFKCGQQGHMSLHCPWQK
jgi:hypothetical protein